MEVSAVKNVKAIVVTNKRRELGQCTAPHSKANVNLMEKRTPTNGIYNNCEITHEINLETIVKRYNRFEFVCLWMG